MNYHYTGVLNIRGADIPYCPFVISYLIITQNTIHWFVDKEKLSPELLEFLKSSNVEILPYSIVHQYIKSLAANPNNPQASYFSSKQSSIPQIQANV
jgi:Xaa-Pro aminopeptidase